MAEVPAVPIKQAEVRKLVIVLYLADGEGDVIIPILLWYRLKTGLYPLQ